MKNFRLFLILCGVSMLLWTLVFLITHCTTLRCYP